MPLGEQADLQRYRRDRIVVQYQTAQLLEVAYFRGNAPDLVVIQMQILYLTLVVKDLDWNVLQAVVGGR